MKTLQGKIYLRSTMMLHWILKKYMRVWNRSMKSGWAVMARVSVCWAVMMPRLGANFYRRCKRTQASRRNVLPLRSVEKLFPRCWIMGSQCRYMGSSTSHILYFRTIFKRRTLTTLYYYNFRNCIVLRVLYLLIDTWSPCWWRMTDRNLLEI